MEWHFRLEGNDFDIKGFRDLVRDEVAFHEDDNGRVFLVMDLAYGASDSTLAMSAAEERLAQLNALAQIIHGDHENVRIGSISFKDASGGASHQYIMGRAGIRGRSRVGGTGLVVTSSSSGMPPQPPAKLIGDRLLDAVSKDAHFERALYLLGSLQLNWRGLYMVLEAAEDAHGGERGLTAKNWVPAGQIKNFKDTANSYNAIKSDARHGSTATGSPYAKIAIEDALTMVRTILEKWGKSLVP